MWPVQPAPGPPRVSRTDHEAAERPSSRPRPAAWRRSDPSRRVVSVSGGDRPDRFAARLERQLAAAAARARDAERSVLLSMAEPIGACDPLDVLELLARHEAATGAGAGDEARTYWSHPAAGFDIAALGAVATLSAEGADRFGAIDRAWRALTDGAVIDDSSGGLDGVGPLLTGGFAFEPEGPRTASWQGFPAALFLVPRVQLTRTNGGCWLTVTLLVGPDGRPDIAPTALLAVRGAALAAAGAARAEASGDDEEPGATEALTQRDARPAPEWRALVGEALAAIRAGTLEKVVLAREVRAIAPGDLDAVAALRHLRAWHRESYVFALWRGARVFVGATPERLVRLEGTTVLASSLAGSARRGATPVSDVRLARDLMQSAKDRAEHEVVRRALCAALALHCDDVVAAATPSILSLPQVHHLHTPVRARLRAEGTLLQVAAALHPTPAVGGAPRDAALGFIRTHERLDRGWYAAPIGWLQRDRGELAVALRCALVTGRQASLFAGCGVVAGSEPEREYAETLLKLQPMVRALAATLREDGAMAVGAAAGEAARVR